MTINYLTDGNGNTIAVQIPIDDWIALLAKYPDIERDLYDVSHWQKEEVLRRKRYYEENPN